MTLRLRHSRYRSGGGVTPPPATGPTVIDEFVAADGTPVDSTKWNTAGASNGNVAAGASQLIYGNRARLRQAVSGTYQKSNIQSKGSFNGGEILVDLVLRQTTEHYFALWAQSSGLVEWSYAPDTGYMLDAQCFDGATTIFIRKCSGHSTTQLGDPVNIGTLAVGSVIHLALRVDATNVSAWGWVGAATRPSSPQITVADTTHRTGQTGVGMQTGGDGLPREIEVDTIWHNPTP